MQLNNRVYQRGISLVELMLYITFAFLVISFALSLVTEAAQAYVRGREVSKVQSNGRYAMAIVARDVMNTGYKTVLSSSTGVLRMKQLAGTYTGTKAITGTTLADSAASFIFKPGNPSDTLEIFKAEMVKPDSLGAVIRARYTLDNNKILWRITRIYDSTVTGRWKAGDTLALSQNIEAFQCRFSIDGINWTDDPTGNRNKITAIQLELLVRTEREVEGTTASSYSIGDITFTPPSSDANYLRRRYMEIVEVVNNGKLY